MSEKLKAKLEIRMKKINDILKILENEDGTEQTFYVIAENLSEEKGLKLLDDIHNVLVDIEALCSDVIK